MKIITKESRFEIDIFDVMHLFMQNQKLDEEKPFVYFGMQQNDRDLYLSFKIDFGHRVEEISDFVKINYFLKSLTKNYLGVV